MFVEVMAFLLKLFASHYCVDYCHIFLIIVRFYAKICFCLTNILFITQIALHQIYNIAAGTIDVVENFFIFFFGLLTLNVESFRTSLEQSNSIFVRDREQLPGFSFCSFYICTIYII